MKITVKVLKSKQNHAFTVEPSDTLEQVIAQIKTLENAPSANVRLLYNQRVLKSDYTYQTQQVADNAVLQATLQEPRTVKTENASMPTAAGSETPKPYYQQAPSVGGFPPFNLGQMDIGNIMNNPFVRYLMSYPGFLNQMMDNPMMQYLKERNPMIGDMMEDPEVYQYMQDIMTDPVKMDEMLRQQDAMMNNISNNPEALRMYYKLRYDMEEIQRNALEHPEQYADFAANAYEAYQNAYAAKQYYSYAFAPAKGFNQRTVAVQVEEQFPLAYIDSLSDWYADKPEEYKRKAAAASANSPFSLFDGATGLDSQQSELMSQLMNNPEVSAFIDNMLNDPREFENYYYNPMLQQQLRQTLPPGSALLDDPERFRQLLLAARIFHKQANSDGAQPQRPTTSGYAPMQNKAQRVAQLRQKYTTELQFIKELGCEFNDDDILLALDYCNGNCEAAMNYLLDSY